MRVVLLGPPGAGKGTQARMLGEQLGVGAVSAGDLLRAAVAAGTEKGREAKGYMERGVLVPDALVLALIEERLAGERGFLLDGFPRNLAQAEMLAAALGERGQEIQHVVSIEVPVADVVARLSGRRNCRQCGALYHQVFSPPATSGRCDSCGGELYQRDDDREETIRARLEVFARETSPLLDYYRRRGLLRTVDGRGTPAAVLAAIMSQLAPGSG